MNEVHVLLREQPEDEVFCEGIIDNPHGLPSWLRGVFFRNGPGLFTMPRGQFNHFFDGPAKIHKFSFINDEVAKVSYHSKFLQTESRKKAVEWGACYYMELGTSPYPGVGLKSRFLSYLDQIRGTHDNLNICVIHYKNEIFVTGETPFIYQIDPESLNITNKIDLQKHYFLHTIAHGVVDPLDDVWYSFGLSVKNFQVCNTIYQIDSKSWNCNKRNASDEGSAMPTQQKSGSEALNSCPVSDSKSEEWVVKKIAQIPCERRFNYNHSIAMTTNYVIYLEQPVSFSAMSMIKARFMHPPNGFGNAMHMIKKNTVFIVVSKATGKVVNRVEANSCFLTMHHVNSYEKRRAENGEDTCIVVHLIAHTSFDVLNLSRNELERNERINDKLDGRLMEFIIPVPNDETPLNKGDTKDCGQQIEGQFLSELYVEFPVINQLNYTLPYKYVWSWGFVQLSDTSLHGICKVDVTTGNYVRWYKSGFKFSEPMFVGRPGAFLEDDGILLCTVLSEVDPKDSFLGIYDAATLTIQCRVTFPGVTLLYGLHGLFVPQQKENEDK